MKILFIIFIYNVVAISVESREAIVARKPRKVTIYSIV